MNYKMIAIDLDDSLLGTDLMISPKNKDALFKAIEQGVIVTIATGRMYISALVYAKQLGLDVPLITYQGGLIKSALSEHILYNKTVPIDISRKIIEISKSRDAHLQIYIEDDYYFEKRNEYSDAYHKNVGVAGKEVGSLDTFLTLAPNKLIIIQEPQRIIELRDEFEKIFGEEIEINISKPQYLEFTHKEATKGKALEHLAGLKGIDRDHIMAIGDSYNDISMIKYAGLGVAMENAPDEVKKWADYITGTNDDDGVAKVINKFVIEGDEDR
ncbi:MAG TPA: Cof-type HAD-IIB family hydrolase [Clostridia bacterium]|nr:Cof-type HAD-IIB family hydrolase [Clostridia bacterium]